MGLARAIRLAVAGLVDLTRDEGRKIVERLVDLGFGDAVTWASFTH